MPGRVLRARVGQQPMRPMSQYVEQMQPESAASRVFGAIGQGVKGFGGGVATFLEGALPNIGRAFRNREIQGLVKTQLDAELAKPEQERDTDRLDLLIAARADPTVLDPARRPRSQNNPYDLEIFRANLEAMRGDEVDSRELRQQLEKEGREKAAQENTPQYRQAARLEAIRGKLAEGQRLSPGEQALLDRADNINVGVGREALTPNKQYEALDRAQRSDSASRKAMADIDRALDPRSDALKDVSLLFNFVKRLDDSTVRDGERQVIERANSLSNRLALLTDNLKEGQIISDDQRAAIRKELEIARDQIAEDRDLTIGNQFDVAKSLGADQAVLKSFEKLKGFGKKGGGGLSGNQEAEKIRADFRAGKMTREAAKKALGPLNGR